MTKLVPVRGLWSAFGDVLMGLRRLLVAEGTSDVPIANVESMAKSSPMYLEAGAHQVSTLS